MEIPITGHTGLIALLAHPAAHSKSPLMHNAAFRLLGLDYVYLAFDVDEPAIGDAVTAIRTFGMRGANLSMPNKQRVMEHLDEIAPEAQLAGAVNTIVNDGGYLTGHNTDGAGWARGVSDLGVSLPGEKITVLGTGGAAKAILAQAALSGVREIAVFNRRSPRWPQAEALTAQIQARTGCRVRLWELNNDDPVCRERLREEIQSSCLLSNATNVGMGRLAGQSCVPDGSFFYPGLAVTDAIYEPKETELLRLAREAGCRTQNGDRMVLYQGAEAFRYWTGQEMPVEQIMPLMGL
ncbi:MAG: quinate/shikimate dehydrogenase [Clostridiales bacterium]|nr:quinate/shikimate dehydrogenase [Clostridiales bacterium]